MLLQYENEKIKKILTNLNELKKYAEQNLIIKYKLYIECLSSADNFAIFLKLGLDHPEKLSSFNLNIWSIRLDKNKRLLIELNDDDPRLCSLVKIKGVYDYHGKKNNKYI